MIKLVIVLGLVGVAWSLAIPQKTDVAISPEELNEDALLKTPELITKYGYPCETHQVTTPDGYILTLHRIPHGKKNNTVSKNVVFLQHGLLSSSVDWIILGVDKALAYTLADEGYDVWMGNARGNTESRKHVTLDPDKSAAFWAFTWHEIGYYDLPTMIDYVLEATGQPNLFYVGHSQGTTSFYVMASMRPEYNDKIRAHISLAPIAYMNHMTSPLLHIIAFWDGPVAKLLELLGINELYPNYGFMAAVGDLLCKDSAITQILCTNAIFAIAGFSPKEMNATLLPIMMGHTPAGASTRQFLHYGQEINSGHFRQYDHGIIGNLVKYGSIAPPDYNLKAITAPVYFLYSHNDWLSAEVDVTRLYKALPNVKGKFLVSDDTFNHMDYLFGIDAPKYVYNKVISLLGRHL